MPESGDPESGGTATGSAAGGSGMTGSAAGGSGMTGSAAGGSGMTGSAAGGSAMTGNATTGNATTGGPTTGGPTSGGFSYDLPPAPYYEDPSTGTLHPAIAPPSTAPYDPFHGAAPHTPTSPHDPFDFSPSSYSGRRIEPSPPPSGPNRLLIGLVAGLVAGLLVFGAGGWLVGRSTAPTATPRATPTTSLGTFERSQVALNRPHFASGLLPIAQGWLPYLSSCSRNGQPGGPALNAGEKTRVRCTLDGMSAIFVQYKSVAERDKARTATLRQGGDARALTPGVGPATRRRTPSGRTAGNYVEYAYKVTEGGTVRPVAGIWWDDAGSPVAAYLLAYWKEGVGENWAPMRDLWSRYA